MRSVLQSAPAPALKLEPRVTGFSEVDGVTHYTVETTVIERTAPGPHGDTATVIVVPASRRFSEFRSLHTTLTQLTPSVADSFPVSKSLFGGETVKKERVKKLQSYLEMVAAATATAPPVALLSFLSLPSGIAAEARLAAVAPRWAALCARETALVADARRKWKLEAEALKMQMAAMDQTVLLLEKEVRLQEMNLVKVEAAEAAAAKAAGGGGAQAGGGDAGASLSSCTPRDTPLPAFPSPPPPVSSISSVSSAPPVASPAAPSPPVCIDGCSATGSRSGELESLLGTLEDKLSSTVAQLQDCRRSSYFPAAEGYRLRFSYKEMYIGFKDLHLEKLVGSAALSIRPASRSHRKSSDGHAYPQLTIRWGGAGQVASTGAPDNGGLLQFVATGVSIVNRTELLGAEFAPALAFGRLAIAASFVAEVPLVYRPNRRKWKFEKEFGIRLLECRTNLGPSDLGPVRTVVSAVIERFLKKLLLAQLGPNLGEYLCKARHGASVSLNLSVTGPPAHLFEQPVAQSHGPAELLGLSPIQMQMVLEAARGLALIPAPRRPTDPDPPPPEGWAAASFDPAAAAAAAAHALDTAAAAMRSSDTPPGLASLSHLVRLLSRLAEVDAPELRATLRLALLSLPAAHYGAFPPDVDALLRRVTELDHKPARVHLSVTSLGLGVEPEAALATIVSAVEEVLVNEKAAHGSARRFLQQAHREGLLFLSAVRRSVRHATAAVAVSMRGGSTGNLIVHCDEAAVDYGPYVSWLFTPAIRDYALQMHVRDDGQIQIDISAPRRPISPRRPTTDAGGGAPGADTASRNSTAGRNSPDGDRNSPGGGATISASTAGMSSVDSVPAAAVPISPLDPGADALTEEESAEAAERRIETEMAWAASRAPQASGEGTAEESCDRVRLLRLVVRRAGVSLIVHGTEMCHVSLVQAPEDMPLPPPPVLRPAPRPPPIPVQARRDGAPDVSMDASPSPSPSTDTSRDASLPSVSDEASGGRALPPSRTTVERRLNAAAERPVGEGTDLVGVAEAVVAWDPAKRTGGHAPPNPVLPATAAAAAAAAAKPRPPPPPPPPPPAVPPRVFEVAATPKPRGPRAVVTVLESERRSAPWRAWGSGELVQRLLPEDAPPGIFSEEAPPAPGLPRRGWPVLSAVPLPLGAVHWSGEWRQDVSAAAPDDGWLYAPTWRGPWAAAPSAITFVRRRRWVRTAELPPPADPPAAGQAVRFDPSVLGPLPPSSRELGARSTVAEALAPAARGLPTAAAAGRRPATAPPTAPQLSDGLALGGALLQMRTAPGARLCLRGSDVEMSARPATLLSHVRAMVAGHLDADELKRPLQLALDVAEKYLMGEALRVSTALSATVLSDGEDGGAFSIHAASRPPAEGEGDGLVPTPCLELENEILMLDLVADVGDLVKAFTTNINRVTPNPTVASARPS